MTTPEKWHRFRELPSDIRQRLPRLKSLLVEEGALLAYVFGSLVQTERPPQDVDLALLMPEDNPPYRLRSHINERLGTTVFPQFAQEVLSWLDSLEEEET